jgi:hypothetical protein
VRPEETAAARIIASITGATIADPSGRHDADLALPDGRTIGLEVTQAMNRKILGDWAAITANQVDEPAPELTRWWSVAVKPGTRIKSAHPIVREQLRLLDALGHTEVNYRSNPQGLPNSDPQVRAVEDTLESAGVVHAFSIPPKTTGGYSFVVDEPGRWIGGQDVTDAVEVEVFKKDNVDKLTMMSTNEAHLFVWIDYSQSAPYSALSGGLLPIPVPNLPAPLDVLWVAPRVMTKQGDWAPAQVMRLSRNAPHWSTSLI